MDNAGTLEVNSLKLVIPIDFLKESIKSRSKSKSQTPPELSWEGLMPDQNVPCKVSTIALSNTMSSETSTKKQTPLLMISVSELELKVTNGQLHFKLSSVEKTCHKNSFLQNTSENDTISSQQSTDSSQTKLLKEPDSNNSEYTKSAFLEKVSIKHRKVDETKNESDLVDQIKSEDRIDDVDLEENKTNRTENETHVKTSIRKLSRPLKRKTLEKIENINNDSGNTEKRYCLRGVKLSKKIMESEKHVTKSGNIKLDLSEPDCSDNDEQDDDYKGEKTRSRLVIDCGNVPTFARRKKGSMKAPCKYCKKCFVDYTGVEDHVKRFHGNQENLSSYLEELSELKKERCETCDVEFANRHQLHDHEDRVHLKISGMKCHICGKTYKNLACLRMHIRVVHIMSGKTSHMCHMCSAKFKWAITLKQHIEEVHEGIKPHSCKTCGKKFYRKSGLNRHEKIHGFDESKKLFCPQCGKWFWFESNLQRHIQVVHNAAVGETFHCSYCGKGFNRNTKMLAHIQHVHFVLPPFTCEICKEAFRRSKPYEEHMAKSHGQTNFKILANRPEHFKYNRTPEDLLYCSYCNQSFCYKAKLVEHMHFTHSDAFPFKCKTCNQGYLERGFLKNHLAKAHPTLKADSADGRKAFECQKCDSDFESKVLLDNHMKKVHSHYLDSTGTELFFHMCEKCNQLFSSRAHLENHNQKVHNLDTHSESEISCEKLVMLTRETQSEIKQSGDSAAVTTLSIAQNAELITNNADNDQEEAPLVVQVTNDGDTIHYIIQQPENASTNDTVTIAQDIASLLFSAGQLQQAAEGGEVTEINTANILTAIESGEVSEINIADVSTGENGEANGQPVMTGGEASEIYTNSLAAAESGEANDIQNDNIHLVIDGGEASEIYTTSILPASQTAD
ncbi:hypothetical protein ScPMuIL_017891 [Solemya velum]